ncbi:hypothetical protein [Marisediminicola antarctica]|uniref:hypothetical protein n=1 Tax=Marisediminicola antarctica TaxID=674079 RepID=UPI00137A5490|nr:hypothetical protein [Marisediminicola antarctica]
MDASLGAVPARESESSDVELFFAAHVPTQDSRDVFNLALRERKQRAAQTAVRHPRFLHAPAVRLVVRVELSELHLRTVVLDPFLGGEVHDGRPTSEVVDHRETTASTGFAGGSLLTRQVHALLAPLALLVLAAMRLRLVIQSGGQTTLLFANLFLLIGECQGGGLRVWGGGESVPKDLYDVVSVALLHSVLGSRIRLADELADRLGVTKGAACCEIRSKPDIHVDRIPFGGEGADQLDDRILASTRTQAVVLLVDH